jgi:hypothetical protein
MDRPYQATFVETSTQAPSPPVFVNLGVNAIGNFGLQIAAPTVQGGASVVRAARQAAAKTGDTSENKDDTKDAEKNQVASKQDSNSREQRKDTAAETVILVNKDATANQVAAVGDTENPYVKKLYKDKSETQQIGWMYESLSPSQSNYTNVILPMGTQVQVIVTQDLVTNSYNFSGGKAQGQIVINQVYR